MTRKTAVPEAEQPYQIPDNWRWATIGAVSTLYRGVSYQKGDAHTVKGEDDILILRGGNIGEGHIDTDSDNVYVNSSLVCKHQIICKHDILIIGSTGSKTVIGRAGIALENYNDVAFGAFLILVRPAETINPQYLDYYFLSDDYRNRMKRLSKGININNIRADYITRCPVPFPPLAEQQRIVERIESQFAKLDAARENAQSVLDGFETRKAAILYRAFHGELTEQWRRAHGLRRSDWTHCKFQEICKIVRGGSPRPAGDLKYYHGNIPFMKVADITNNPGPYVSSAEHTIKEAGLKKTRMISANTLLLTNSGATLGVPAICTFDTTINDGIAAFLGLNPDFILFYYYFWLGKTQELRAINMGMAQPNLNTSIIGNVEIDLPTDIEKKEIVRIVSATLSKQEQAKDTARQVLDNIDAMKKVILGRAFRGELGTNRPSEAAPEASR